jgi:porphobilinogen synthase
MTKIGNFPKSRLRRLRDSNWIRELVSENNLSVSDLVLPIFIREGKNKIEAIKSMPGVYRYSIDRALKLIDSAEKNGIPMVALFPATPKKLKNNLGTEALNENNLICKMLKKTRRNNNIGIMTDVALDPYTSHGHDGILKNGKILNDETNSILIKQAILQAEMGSDVIAPSDMMDGRIGLIRKALDKNKLKETRDAVGSKKNLKGDKKTYQMDFRNMSESIREVAMDVKEGADMIMVKPGLPYLDIITKIKDNFKLPILAYQVSGEYTLLKQGILNKTIGTEAIIESLYSFKRAGCSAIITYFALEIAKQFKKN